MSWAFGRLFFPGYLDASFEASRRYGSAVSRELSAFFLSTTTHGFGHGVGYEDNDGGPGNGPAGRRGNVFRQVLPDELFGTRGIWFGTNSGDLASVAND